MTLLKKVVQITDAVSLTLVSLEGKAVDIIYFNYLDECNASLTLSSLDKPLSVCAYELVHEAAQNVGLQFAMGIDTQKELLQAMKCLKAVRTNLDENDKMTFSVYLTEFECNQ